MITELNNNSLTRNLSARVELYEGSTLLAEHTSGDRIINFTIERVGENSKFFGFGVCQSLNLHLIDLNRELEYGTQNTIKCYLNCDTWGTEVDGFPGFKISEIHRDENTNELSITAYDAIYDAAAHRISSVVINKPYSVLDVVTACANMIGISAIELIGVPVENNPFDTTFVDGANFDGAETLREVFDNIAEVTQTIYYVNPNGNLVFKRFDKDGAPVLTIGKDDYVELSSKTNRRLSDICSANELGDNIITTSGIIGTVQYVRDNPFWELRDDIVTLLNNAIAAVGGLTINQFECYWRGNPALEIGDKIALITKDNETVFSYVIDDVIDYTGGLEQTTQWSYSESNSESADNPVTLGDALKKTYAKVDKANQQISIVAGEMSSIKLTNESIQSTVTQLDEEMNNVLNEVSTVVTADDVSIAIQTAMEQGIDRVTTTTGFTFNENGLHVSKTNSQVTTTITEDGMTVLRNDEEVLVADNLGVKAEDLHATTFLIIGTNSRFEDYDGNRTGCFYIGKS